jgi:hypothetical protein
VATNSPGRVSRYVSSTKNIAGCVGALGGPILAAAGVVNPLLGLALIPPLYAAAALLAPPAKRVNLAAGTDPADVRRSLSEIQRRIRRRVPAEVADRVNRIATMILDALPKADNLGPTSQDTFILVRTATDYLPSALQAYLDLPRSYADSAPVSGGKTARVLLIEQLEMLEAKLGEVADAIHRSDADKLVAHGRFLAEKFGHGGLDLGPPGTGPAPSGPS